MSKHMEDDSTYPTPYQERDRGNNKRTKKTSRRNERQQIEDQLAEMNQDVEDDARWIADIFQGDLLRD